eukprot:TRINITY_DN12997_c0_g1_i1.p1 TRINITY_DN12997_c0_g1~~TRINITY_DN12997_c0_g1_i1.p1  ORF type:complete len:235 (+),score=87.75 TRINITY_DN12997_c0_g1_i1:83-787(+)
MSRSSASNEFKDNVALALRSELDELEDAYKRDVLAVPVDASSVEISELEAQLSEERALRRSAQEDIEVLRLGKAECRVAARLGGEISELKSELEAARAESAKLRQELQLSQATAESAAAGGKSGGGGSPADAPKAESGEAAAGAGTPATAEAATPANAADAAAPATKPPDAAADAKAKASPAPGGYAEKAASRPSLTGKSDKKEAEATTEKTVTAAPGAADASQGSPADAAEKK